MNSNCWCCFVFLVLDMTIELMIVHHQKKSTKATKTLATTTTPRKRTHKFECTHENCDHTRCYVPWKPREQQRNFDVHFFLNEPQKWNERKKKTEKIFFSHIQKWPNSIPNEAKEGKTTITTTTTSKRNEWTYLVSI